MSLITTGNTQTISVNIATNLSAKSAHFVSIADNGQYPTVALLEAATSVPFILVEGADGSTTATDGTIAVSGITTLKIGGNVTAGDKITTTTGGVGITTITDRNNYGAIALESGASGDEIRVLVIQGMISAA